MRDLFVAGSKLMGIYFLYLALTNLPPSIGMVLLLFSKRSIIEGIPFFGMFAAVLSNIVMLVFALGLLFKTELIADNLNIAASRPAPKGENNLESGIILIGIYIFCTKIGMLAEIFAVNQRANSIRYPFAATQPQEFAFSSDYIAPSVMLIASLFLIFGGKYIAMFLTREKQTATEQGASLDRE